MVLEYFQKALESDRRPHPLSSSCISRRSSVIQVISAEISPVSGQWGKTLRPVENVIFLASKLEILLWQGSSEN